VADATGYLRPFAGRTPTEGRLYVFGPDTGAPATLRATVTLTSTAGVAVIAAVADVVGLVTRTQHQVDGVLVDAVQFVPLDFPAGHVILRATGLIAGMRPSGRHGSRATGSLMGASDGQVVPAPATRTGRIISDGD
jgi:hypothetical protein